MSTLNSVMLPIMRRVIPQLIAQDICGVQPMTGPIGNIFTMKTEVSLDTKIAAFEGYICEITGIVESEWTDVFMNKEVWEPIVRVLRRLGTPDTICEDELHAMADHIANWFSVLDKNYPDCAFDLQMRGIDKVWTYE